MPLCIEHYVHWEATWLFRVVESNAHLSPMCLRSLDASAYSGTLHFSSTPYASIDTPVNDSARHAQSEEKRCQSGDCQTPLPDPPSPPTCYHNQPAAVQLSPSTRSTHAQNNVGIRTRKERKATYGKVQGLAVGLNNRNLQINLLNRNT